MLAVLSPAKSLDFSPSPAPLPHSSPELLEETERLATRAKQLSPADLRRLMGISDKLADLNHARFQAFGHPVLGKTAKQAALAFSGDTYVGLNANTLSPDDLVWGQDHVRILSGLYGALRPLDLIEPYRLEMGIRLDTERGADLYTFWKGRVSAVIERAVVSHPAPVVIILASEEYAKVLRDGSLKARTITPVFREESAETSRVISFMAKRARGMMARFMILNRIENPERLKDFGDGGYKFRPEQSDEKTWVFSRPKP